MHTGGDVGGHSIHKRLQEDLEKVKEEFELEEENRIREDKMSPKCLQYRRPCPRGESPWKTLLHEFRKRVPEGKECPLGKYKLSALV